ncbi:hypothetical protein O988_00015 [Pseudogymnoascus sp. VKM F-3808]|nr:hypothetical protein O988_00015 [Pseudogymnoascus sp. VKM F-3808]
MLTPAGKRGASEDLVLEQTSHLRRSFVNGSGTHDAVSGNGWINREDEDDSASDSDLERAESPSEQPTSKSSTRPRVATAESRGAKGRPPEGMADNLDRQAEELGARETARATIQVSGPQRREQRQPGALLRRWT